MTNYNGTISSLLRCYQSDPVSTWHKLRPRTRATYERLCRRVDFDRGDIRVAEIKYRTLLLWHKEWSDDGKKVRMGHSLIGLLRILVNFGAAILEDSECARVAIVLRQMRVPMGHHREERMTAEQATAIRRTAHAMGLHSIARAQSFQFECALRQTDLVGEWVAIHEHGVSDVIHEGRKWLRGIRGEEIRDLVLRHVTSKKQKEVEIDLRLAPMVMGEIARSPLPAFGPLIVYEVTGRPFESHQFRRLWRKVARAAGVPDSIWNMDSRAGAISEATDAGASLELTRHLATHSNVATTANYSRGTAEKIREVQRMRAAKRAS